MDEQRLHGFQVFLDGLRDIESTQWASVIRDEISVTETSDMLLVLFSLDTLDFHNPTLPPIILRSIQVEIDRRIPVAGLPEVPSSSVVDDEIVNEFQQIYHDTYPTGSVAYPIEILTDFVLRMAHEVTSISTSVLIVLIRSSNTIHSEAITRAYGFDLICKEIDRRVPVSSGASKRTESTHAVRSTVRRRDGSR